MKKVLTIGIAAHNEEKNIRRVLSGVLGNAIEISVDGLLVEVVIAANGCTDSTERIVEEFASENRLPFRRTAMGVQSLVPEPERHPVSVSLISIPEKSKTAAWNAIYDHSLGGMICFFDADIILHRGVVRRLYKTLLDAPGVFAVSCNIQPHKDSKSGLVWTYQYLREKMSRSFPITKISGPGYILRKTPDFRIEIPGHLLHQDAFLYTYIATTDVTPFNKGLEKIRWQGKAVIYHAPIRNLRQFYSNKVRSHYSVLQLRALFGEKYDQVQKKLNSQRGRKRDRLRLLRWRDRFLYYFLKKVYPGPLVSLLKRIAFRKAEKLFNGLGGQDIWPTGR